MRWVWMLGLVACAPPTDRTPVDTDVVAWSPYDAGTHGAGVWRGSWVDGTRDDRSLPVMVWYPSTAASEDLFVEGLADTSHTSRLAALYGTAPEGCPSRRVAAAPGGAVSPGRHPALVLSHCHQCLGVSLSTLAGHLAAHGWVVVLPDHVGNTLVDLLDGDGGSVNNSWLDTRVADARGVLGALRTGALGPEGLSVDADRIAVGGHSFGAMTAGRVLAAEPGLAAGVYVHAPPDNPLYTTLDVAAETRPQMFAVATEDASILEAGNQILRANAADAGGASYAVELVDAGHWSISDLLGMVPQHMAGCGAGERADGTGAFTYPAPGPIREDLAAEVLAFLQATVMDDAEAAAWLAAGDRDDVLTSWNP